MHAAVIRQFYDRGDCVIPAYLPAEGPVEKHYRVGKRKWENAFRRGDVSFNRLADAEGHLIADFDLEGHEVYAYRKVLPKQMRPEKSGRSVRDQVFDEAVTITRKRTDSFPGAK